MTQEEKQLLLVDLCSRLPYGVKFIDSYGDIYKTTSISWSKIEGYLDYNSRSYYFEDIKPYLFPLSSMTEQQKEELLYNYIHNDIYFDDFVDYFLAGELWHDICVSLFDLPQLIDWLNKNHFDWRGLIPKGLANDATGLNIY